MARANGYLDSLASIPLFAACSRKDIQKIARASDQVSVPAGKVLVEQGTTGRECFMIVDGTAVVRRNHRKIATLGPGDYFGELALLDKGERTATVTAETPLTVLVLGPREFASVLDEVPGLTRKLLATLAARVRALDAQAYG
jgi:CRP-like cAMP-binding protein